MVYCIELAMPPAIQTSSELWPERIEAIPDVSRYLQWHQEVRPGGRAHPPTQASGIQFQASSVKDLSLALIVALDDFHHFRTNPESVPPGLDLPEGVKYPEIRSLAGFFLSPRCYAVYVLHLPALILH